MGKPRKDQHKITSNPQVACTVVPVEDKLLLKSSQQALAFPSRSQHSLALPKQFVLIGDFRADESSTQAEADYFVHSVATGYSATVASY